MMIQWIQSILELVDKCDTAKSPGLWTAHVDVNTNVTSARISMFIHGRGEQEGNLAQYLNLRICKLYVINCNFVTGYWDTTLMQYFCN